MNKRLQVGEEFHFQNKKIRLVNVGSSGSVIIDVDGTVDTILKLTTETINSIRITNKKTYYKQKKSERSAHLVLG